MSRPWSSRSPREVTRNAIGDAYPAPGASPRDSAPPEPRRPNPTLRQLAPGPDGGSGAAEARLSAHEAALRPDRRHRWLDQDRAEVVDVGQRRSGHDAVAKRAKKPWLSCASSAACGSSPAARARASVSGPATAPAISAAPSTPSVSQARTWMPGRAAQRQRRRQHELGVRPAAEPLAAAGHGALAAAEREPAAGRPAPSPPAARARPRPATGARSRASPSSASPRISTRAPCSRATRRRRLERAARAPRSPGSRPGRGAGRRAAPRRRGRGEMPRHRLGRGRRPTAPGSPPPRPASPRVPTVGPLAMSAGSSPGTSEITSASVRAGNAAAASRPPLTADSCLRTAFISPIGAPGGEERARHRLLVLERQPLGRGAEQRRAAARDQRHQRVALLEPRDEVRGSAASPRPRPRRAPGCAASTISIPRVGRPWP